MLFLRLFIATFLLILLSACSQVWNNPHEDGLQSKDILFTAFSSRPKHLDPVVSYSENEWTFNSQIYEPLLQYSYLKVPYQLEPLTLAKMPEKEYLSADKQIIANTSDAAYTRYTFKIKENIYYQPHPAFAKTRDGKFLFHDLTNKAVADIKSPIDFNSKATRKLIVDDYIYAIKRMAVKRNKSPILTSMNQFIVGLENYSTNISKEFDLKEDYQLKNHNIIGVKKLSDTEFSITIKGIYPQFVYWLSMNFFAPIPWEAVAFYDQRVLKDKNISLDTFPVGTGAYQMIEHIPNKVIRLTANPNYNHGFYPSEASDNIAKHLLKDAGKPLPFIREIIYSRENESVPAWNKFLQGFYDASGVSSSSFDQAISFTGGDMNLTKQMLDKKISHISVVEPSIFYLGFNMVDSVVGGYSESQQKLRQALSIVINQEEYISIFLNGRGVAGHSPIPNGIFGSLTGEEGINSFVYNWKNNRAERKSIVEAKKLLAEAGYKNGVDKDGKQLVLNFDTALTGPDSKAILNWYRKQFKKLNIELIIRATDYNRFQDKVRTAQVQIFSFGWNADYPDPENFLFLLAGENATINTNGAGINSANYDNPKYNQLFKQVKEMSNSPARQQIINQMVEIARQDSPWSFGFYPKELVLKHHWYHNVWLNPLANNTLKYKRIDAQARSNAIAAWNKPITWPIWLLLAIILLSIYPLLKAYRNKQQAVIK
ncbi:MAG TPA: peptide ABC transporter substrate-binding protein [Thiomicrospira sp.]|nr:peptide ABC transporter substrate-binding protein [Thiomicrospira sp.]